MNEATDNNNVRDELIIFDVLIVISNRNKFQIIGYFRKSPKNHSLLYCLKTASQKEGVEPLFGRLCPYLLPILYI